MKNGIFQLKANDFIKGLATAIYAAIIVTLYNVAIVNGFDFFTVNYVELGKSVVNVGGVTLLAYLFKNLTSTNDGSVLGITPEDKK